MKHPIEIFEPNDAARARFVSAIVAACRNGGTIGRATFIKRDGTPRKLRFIAAQSRGYVAKGDAAAARRDHNNPHLLRLIDLDLYRAARRGGSEKQDAMKAAFRTLNARTCTELRAHGILYRLA